MQREYREGKSQMAVGIPEEDFLLNREINEPDAEFEILSYIITHKEMIINVIGGYKSGPYSLLFQSVLYHEGPTKWRGGRLRIGDDNEVKQILSRIQHPSLESMFNYDQRLFWENYRLFVIESPHGITKIIAHKSAIRLNEKPKRISYLTVGKDKESDQHPADAEG